MRARVGDRLRVRRSRVGEPVRHAEVLEVRGGEGPPRYLVRWSDGHESVFAPGSETVVEPAAAPVPLDEVEGASEESFPASDPPSWTHTRGH